jgi:hypothetical protein
MQIDDFRALNDSDKEEFIWSDGIFMANYDEGNVICDVYQLFDFYVAFCYELQKNERAVITAHVNPDELPLLKKLDIIF